jgi:hypothetical protein
MKRITLVLCLLMLAAAISAQSLATIVFSEENENLPENGTAFNIPINVAGFLDQVRYVEVVFEYNSEALQFIEVINLQNPSCQIRVTDTLAGTLIINYNQVTAHFPVSDGKLFDIQFEYLEGSSSLNFGVGSRYRIWSTIYIITEFTHGELIGLYVNNHIEGGIWDDPNNWSKNVLPDHTHNVFIQGLTTIGSEAICRNLTIQEAEQLIITPNGRLTVNGVLTNNAGINGLVLESTIDGAGSLLHNTQEVRATVQRFIPGPENTPHQISSPMGVMEISSDFGDASIFTWFEPAQSWVSYNNHTVWPTWNDANNSDYFMCAKGYMAGIPFIGGNPQTKLFTGELNSGSLSFNLSFQAHPDDPYQGFNLAGNPYPSSIDWKSAEGWDRSSLLMTPDDEDGYAYWVWNPDAGQYGTYHSGQISETGTAGTSRFIAPTQGFWVKAGQSGVLGMDNRVRAHSDQIWMKNQGSTPNVLHMEISSTINPYRDEIILELGHEVNRGGAVKMFSIFDSAPSLYAINNNTAYSISFYGSPDEQSKVFLGFEAGADAIYTLTATGLESFNELLLEDLQTGIRHLLSHSDSYIFHAKQGDDPQRFVLHFTALGVETQSTLKPHTLFRNGELTVYIPWQNKVKMHVTDAGGRKVNEYLLNPGHNHIALSQAPGFYLLTFQSSTQITTTKLIIP